MPLVKRHQNNKQFKFSKHVLDRTCSVSGIRTYRLTCFKHTDGLEGLRDVLLPEFVDAEMVAKQAAWVSTSRASALRTYQWDMVRASSWETSLLTPLEVQGVLLLLLLLLLCVCMLISSSSFSLSTCPAAAHQYPERLCYQVCCGRMFTLPRPSLVDLSSSSSSLSLSSSSSSSSYSFSS